MLEGQGKTYPVINPANGQLITHVRTLIYNVMYLCMNIFIYVCMYACMYVCMYVCTYVHACMYVCYQVTDVGIEETKLAITEAYTAQKKWARLTAKVHLSDTHTHLHFSLLCFRKEVECFVNGMI